MCVCVRAHTCVRVCFARACVMHMCACICVPVKKMNVHKAEIINNQGISKVCKNTHNFVVHCRYIYMQE